MKRLAILPHALLAVTMASAGLTLLANGAPTVSIQGAPSRGNAEARVVVVEFSDFQCPYCGKYARETFSSVNENYIVPGKVRYVFRHFPMDEAHPKAFRAAEAAECANQQGKFWEMHDRLFANQQALEPADLVAHAKTIGLEEAAFGSCLNGSTKGRIKRDFNDGLKAGVNGTPTFLMGTLEKDGKVRVLKTLAGTQTTASFTVALDALLTETASSGSPR